MKTTRPRFNRASLLWWGCLFGLLAGVPAWGQGFGPSQEPPIIDEIEIKFLEIRNISVEAVMAHILLRDGQPYDQSLVERSIRSLYQTNRFDFVEATTEELPNNRVKLIFSLQNKYRLIEVKFEGNEEYSDARLRDLTTLRPGFALDERLINDDRDAIFEHYQKKGYSQAIVDYDIERDKSTGYGRVTYRIDEGERLRIGEINFIGNDSISNGDLLGVMETTTYKWYWSWITGSGRFNETELQEDIEKLRTYYKSEGYLDVDISESDVTLETRDDNIAINIRIDEGRQYTVGTVTVEGNDIFPTMVLLNVLQLSTGDVFSPEKLREDRTSIEDLYGSGGYLGIGITVDRVANLESGDIDLHYRIDEGEKFQVETVIIEGNTKTKNTVILRELALSPGDTFNLVWMKNSEARLRNTRFFDEVSLTDEPTNIPNRRNLKVRLKEGRTGNFQFGGGFSSIESVTFFFELQQSNFDLFNYRSFFQGDGQKFRFRTSIGSRSNFVLLSFEEPWLFEQRLALGVDLFRSSTNFNSSLFDEVRAGFEVSLRKQLIELWVGTLSYRLENVNIKNVASNAPSDIERLAGDRIVSKVGFNLRRDTRDDILFTTRGTRYSFTVEYAGLGGNTEYVKLETRNAFYFPTFDSLNQVFSVLIRGGTIWPYGEREVPFFDRFFLGGPDDLRGFDFREVGPREIAQNPTNNEPILDAFGRPFFTSPEVIGGNSYGFFSAEYSIGFGEQFRAATFYDWGFVNRDQFDFDPSDYNSNWGVGIRMMMLGNPMRLDFGIPLRSFEGAAAGSNRSFSNDDGGKFNISFGTRF